MSVPSKYLEGHRVDTSLFVSHRDIFPTLINLAVSGARYFNGGNFLFDKSTKPYASVDDINDFFGTKKATTSGKSKIIRDLLKMRYWDNEFSTKAMQESNPYANMVSINGLIMPIGALPPEIQETVKDLKKTGKDFTLRF